MTIVFTTTEQQRRRIIQGELDIVYSEVVSKLKSTEKESTKLNEELKHE